MPRGRPRKNRVDGGGVGVVDGVPIRTLDVSERKEIQRELDQRKSMLSATADFSVSEFTPAIPEGVEIDKSKLQAGVNRLQAVLDRESPRRVSDQAKRARIEARMKELEASFTPYLETYQDIGCMKQDTPEYREAYDKAIKRPLVEGKIREWKELAKSLEPEDPSFCSLNRLRRPK